MLIPFIFKYFIFLSTKIRPHRGRIFHSQCTISEIITLIDLFKILFCKNCFTAMNLSFLPEVESIEVLLA